MKESELFTKIAENILWSYNPYVWGECNEINATAGYFLKKLGFEIECHHGYVEVECWKEEDLFKPKHFWLKYKGLILDFASLQFKESFINEEINNKMNRPYFIGECDKYISIGSIGVENEWTNKELVNNEWLNPEDELYIEIQKYI